MDKRHLIKCELHIKGKSPREVARKALAIIKRDGFADKKNKLTTGYVVRWSIDIFDKSMREAKIQALEWVREPRGTSLCHMFELKNKKTRECFLVDLDEVWEDQLLPLTEKEFNR